MRKFLLIIGILMTTVDASAGIKNFFFGPSCSSIFASSSVIPPIDSSQQNLNYLFRHAGDLASYFKYLANSQTAPVKKTKTVFIESALRPTTGYHETDAIEVPMHSQFYKNILLRYDRLHHVFSVQIIGMGREDQGVTIGTLGNSAGIMALILGLQPSWSMQGNGEISADVMASLQKMPMLEKIEADTMFQVASRSMSKRFDQQNLNNEQFMDISGLIVGIEMQFQNPLVSADLSKFSPSERRRFLQNVMDIIN